MSTNREPVVKSFPLSFSYYTFFEEPLIVFLRPNYIYLNAHTFQLRYGCIVYPFDMFGYLATDASFMIKHHFCKYHSVQWLVILQGKEYRCDTILTE